MMKRFKIKYVYIIIALLFLCTLYLYPRKLNNSYSAIIYRLGDKKLSSISMKFDKNNKADIFYFSVNYYIHTNNCTGGLKCEDW